MNKYEFLYRLDRALVGFGPGEKAEIVRYYEELIQDARDSGETEEEFIDRLGSVETIVRTIRKDGNFVTNVKEKKNFQLRKVFDVTVRIIGYSLFGIFAFAVGTAAFSISVAGISSFFASAVAFARNIAADASTANTIMCAGGMLIGISLLMGGYLGFRWIFRESRGLIEKSIEFADRIVTKIGGSHNESNR
jgi:uncharacterized membrane protein